MIKKSISIQSILIICCAYIIITITQGEEFEMKSFGLLENLPKTLEKLYLIEQHFSQRFQLIHQIEDPYGRVYDISRDIQTNKRVAVRSYTTQEPQQQRDVLQNMESFRKLGDEEGMCKLIAFAKKRESGIISAAFEYSDFSIEELLQSREYEKERYQLYFLILKEMVHIIGNANLAGITIQQIIPSCILLQSLGSEFHIKILYDERQKRYDKIQEGIKVLASPEKISTYLNQMGDYESTDCEQAIFELGLLLLDVAYEFEMWISKISEENVFTKDLPLQRNNISHKSYLFIEENVVELNKPLIKQKMDFLTSLSVPYISQMVDLIKKMIEPVDRRIDFESLIEEIKPFHEIMMEAVKFQKKRSIDQNTFTTPGKESISLESEHNKNIAKKQENNSNAFGINNNIKNVISQTTIASPQYTSTTDNLPKHLELISDTKVVQIFIPREQLLSKARKCTYILPKFQEFITKLQDRIGIVKKEYLDGSIYYGSLNSSSKREGSGIYLNNTNDIYFGIWKDNALIDGNYLFQNGESFEGIVKNGKQGFGRYCYSNGNIYEGQWRDDVKNGMGRMKYPNGDIYDGMWSKGKKNGQGKYLYSNGTQYIGNFVDGKKNGFGTITFPNATKVEAYWNQKSIEGPGKVFYTNGNYFEGNYHQSQKDGRGFYKWQDMQYEGQFKKDLMQGQACIRFSEKQFYKGRIKNGKRDGKGIYQYPNGDEFNGDWRNDQKVLGHYKFSQGGSFQGRFKLNQLSYGIMVYQNGQCYEGQFWNGVRHGLGVYKGVKGQMLYQGKWQRDQFVGPL